MSLSEMLKAIPELSKEDEAVLLRVGSQMQYMADLSNTDIFLDCPIGEGATLRCRNRHTAAHIVLRHKAIEIVLSVFEGHRGGPSIVTASCLLIGEGRRHIFPAAFTILIGEVSLYLGNGGKSFSMIVWRIATGKGGSTGLRKGMRTKREAQLTAVCRRLSAMSGVSAFM